jgi:hypothetical protein
LKDDPAEIDADVLELRLAVIFPNLTEQERNGIARAHVAARAVSTLPEGVDPFSAEYDAYAAQSAEERLAAIEVLEQYGLRAKLSDFQERMLTRLCEVPDPFD